MRQVAKRQRKLATTWLEESYQNKSRPEGTPETATFAKSLSLWLRFRACRGLGEAIGLEFMGGQPETTALKETKKSFNWRGPLLWMLVIIVGYFLSAGPVLKYSFRGAELDGKTVHRMRTVNTIYRPWLWLYLRTPLHKPMGIYMHLWLPEIFNGSGEIIQQ
jgi:hypothetical protein